MGYTRSPHRYSRGTRAPVAGTTEQGKRNKVELRDLQGLNLFNTDAQIDRRNTPFARNFRVYGRDEPRKRAPIISRLGSKELAFKDKKTNRPAPPADQLLPNVDIDRQYFSATQELCQFVDVEEGKDLSGIRVWLKKECVEDGVVVANLYRLNDDGSRGESEAGFVINHEDISDSNVAANNIYFNHAICAGRYLLCFRLEGNYKVVEDEDTLCSEVVQDDNSKVFFVADPLGASITRTFSSVLDLCQQEEFVDDNNAYGLAIETIREETSRGLGAAEFCCNDKTYIIWATEENGKATLCRTDIETGVTTEIFNAGISAESKRVRFAIAGSQDGGHIYWVDGVNNPRRWHCNSGVEDLSYGFIPSLILYHEGRLYYNDTVKKNRIWFTNIDVQGTPPNVEGFPDYENVDPNNWFNIPQNSDDVLGCAPVTAMVSFDSEILFWTQQSMHRYVSDSGFDNGSAGIIDIDGIIGTHSQENVTLGDRTVYFYFNGKIYYTVGNTPQAVSIRVQPELKRIQPENFEDVLLGYYDKELRVYYTRGDGKYNDHMLLFYEGFKDWAWDDHSYVSAFVPIEHKAAMFELHSNLPVVSQAEVSFTNLGEPIYFRYYTAYQWFSSMFAETRVHRLYVKFSAIDNYWVDIGWDYDFRNLPKYTRKFIIVDSDQDGDLDVDDRDGTVYAGSITQDVQVTPSGRGEGFQARIRSDLYDTQLELVGILMLTQDRKVT